MKFMFVCGGTAGHINPALAIAEKLRKLMPDSKILFVGAGRRLENILVPQAGYEIKNIKMSGFARGFTPSKLYSNVKTVKNLIKSGAEAERLLKNFSPNAVIGTGGYICYPVLKKASKLGIPTFIHESNAIAGLTTKLLSASATKVLVAFNGLEKQYRRPERVVCTGTPVREGFKALNTVRSGKPLVVSFWGSLGAERMNAVMSEFIGINSRTGLFRHIHATGGGDSGLLDMKARLEKIGITEESLTNTELRTYIDNMPQVMASADLILCRAGASTIAELTAMQKPAILVPSPYVTNNHQEENAKQQENAGGAVMLKESDCTAESLYGAVAGLVKDEKRLKSMQAALGEISPGDAGAKIVELIITHSC